MNQGEKLEEMFICPTCGFELSDEGDKKHVCVDYMLKKIDVLRAIEEAFITPRTKGILLRKLQLKNILE